MLTAEHSGRAEVFRFAWISNCEHYYHDVIYIDDAIRSSHIATDASHDRMPHDTLSLFSYDRY